MLYFIKSQNYLKIGYSRTEKSLVQRIKDYKTHNPNFIILDIVKDGKQEDETTLHHIIKNYKYYNEWFYDNPYVHKVWNNYTKEMSRIDIQDILDQAIDENKYSENKILRATKDLQEQIGDEFICYDIWDIKDILYKIYRKYKMKGSPTLQSLEQFGYTHKRVRRKSETYLKIYKIE